MEFEVKMTSGILYNYLLRQNYMSFSGWTGIALGIMLIVFYFFQGSIWFVVAGVIILFYPPWSLFTKSKKQMLINPAFKKPLYYHIDDEGVKVSQGEDTVSVLWEQLFRAVAAKKSIIIYTSPVNAWILPFQDLGENGDKLRELIKAKMPAAKVKF
ncbi:MAG: YcxB family protein [Lachnospiraceae bacterium]|nr:YcxB family protein [Lachnospiraceae bacterium]